MTGLDDNKNGSMIPGMKPPSAFRTMRGLKILNIAGVGLTLAAVTSLVFGYMLKEFSFGGTTLVTGLPTLLLGTLWAMLLRWRDEMKFGSRRLRTGWLLSLPLAAANGGLAAAILMFKDGSPSGALERAVGGLFLGATFGALVWVPALLITLLLFGLPIARAQRLAAQGLSGEERGERILGLTNLTLSALVFLGIAMAPASERSPGAYDLAGFWTLVTMATGGLFTGAAAAISAHLREKDRSRFVGAVEEGKVAGYRVESTREGKVLLRVSSEGEGYRAAEFDEELYALDEEGKVKEELRRRALAG